MRLINFPVPMFNADRWNDFEGINHRNMVCRRCYIGAITFKRRRIWQ